MWKKAEANVSSRSPAKTTPVPRSETGSTKAHIGERLFLKGDLFGEEDVIIEGKITLKQHTVIVRESGRVEADISAPNIRIAGEVRGNLTGTEVVLLKTALLEGNIAAKSVTLEAGAQFKGSIDMETGRATAGGGQYPKRAATESGDPPASKPNAPTRGRSVS